MKTKIERISYGYLRIDEFPMVMEQTYHIVGKYDTNELLIGKSYGELLSFRPALSALTIYVRKNAKITLLSKLDTERDTDISCVNKAVKAFENILLPEIAPHYETLSELLNKHKTRTIASVGRTAETDRLLLLEADIAASAAAQAALAAFGLQPIVNRLFAVNHEYEALFRDYITESSEAEHIDFTLLRRDCSKALTQFLDAVQYNAYANEGLNYVPLVNELNKLYTYYIQQLKARATRRKNGKKTEEEAPIPPLTEDGKGTLN